MGRGGCCEREISPARLTCSVCCLFEFDKFSVNLTPVKLR